MARPPEGTLRRLHPLTVMALVGAATLVAYGDLLPWRGVPLAPWTGVGGLALLAASDGGPTVRRWLGRTLLLLAPFALSYLLMQGFFAPHPGPALFHLGPFPFAEAGLFVALRYLGRVALPLAATALMSVVVAPTDAIQALEERGLPHELSYVLLSAITLLPALRLRAAQIQAAQQARGLRTRGSPLVRLRALLPLIAPLLHGALRDADARALALEARGFRSAGPRTPWRTLRDSPAQRVARWLLLGAALLLFLYGRVAP